MDYNYKPIYNSINSNIAIAQNKNTMKNEVQYADTIQHIYFERFRKIYIMQSYDFTLRS